MERIWQKEVETKEGGSRQGATPLDRTRKMGALLAGDNLCVHLSLRARELDKKRGVCAVLTGLPDLNEGQTVCGRQREQE